jgi:hypothetical protein
MGADAERFSALSIDRTWNITPEVDDLLDDLREAGREQGRQVVIVPVERMPTRTGIAAIYRF